MTLYDDQWEFSDSQDIASGTLSATSSVLSEDVKDLHTGQTDAFGTAINHYLGEQAKPLVWVVQVTGEACVNTASGTVTAKLYSRASSATITSADSLHATITIATGAAIGTKYTVPLPWGAYKRYLGVYYTAVTGNLTAGYVSSYICEASSLVD